MILNKGDTDKIPKQIKEGSFNIYYTSRVFWARRKPNPNIRLARI